MGFTTIKSSFHTTSGDVVGGSARVKALWIAHSGNVGVVKLRDGSATGTIMMTLNTALAADEYQCDVPEPGIRFETKPYIAITGGISSVTVFYD
jgi:hypothetical protein